MKPHTIKHFLWSSIILILVAFLSGCASFGPTKPNIPFAGNPYPAVLNELASKNPLLAQELGKLPEMQDGISKIEKTGLENIVKVYSKTPDTFNEVFEEIYQVGLPEKRKYCSPLQALFWLVVDEKLSSESDPLVVYSLSRLLDMSWRKYSALSLSEEQIVDIIDGINDDHRKKNCLVKMQFNSIDAMWDQLIKDYNKDPKIFSKPVQSKIKMSLNSKYAARWSDFKTVVERLNAPELIDYYERKRFNYKYTKSINREQDYDYYNVFKTNKGRHCVQITAFTVYCLRKNGYKARELRVKSISGRHEYHAVTLFEMHGEKYIMDNGRGSQKGIIPFDGYCCFFD